LFFNKKRSVDTVDNSGLNKRVVLLKQEPTVEHRRFESHCGPKVKTSAAASSVRCAEGDVAPGWWFHYFEPVWGPFIRQFRCQKTVTLPEFERAASQIPGLTHIEKTIAVSAFHQQQRDGLVSSHTTTAFRSEHSLSVV
jgi:hypothetical protein